MTPYRQPAGECPGRMLRFPKPPKPRSFRIAMSTNTFACLFVGGVLGSYRLVEGHIVLGGTLTGLTAILLLAVCFCNHVLEEIWNKGPLHEHDDFLVSVQTLSLPDDPVGGPFQIVRIKELHRFTCVRCGREEIRAERG